MSEFDTLPGSATPSPPTVAELLLARAQDTNPGLLFEDEVWTWSQFVDESRARAHLLLAAHDPGRPFHVGVMLENCPDYMFTIGAAALSGATVVGVNLTRRGEELATDIRFTDCELLVTSSDLLPLLDGSDIAIAPENVILIDSDGYRRDVAGHLGRPLDLPAAAFDPSTRLFLLFTSGSTGAPKAVICSTGRMARIAGVKFLGLDRDDVSYNSMPLFHGNALMACWANPLLTGGSYALARRFSASRFLDDLLKFGATYVNYVGRSLAYVLAQPERPQERQTRLRFAFGTEASDLDRAEFTRRYGVAPIESYGSSEGAISMARTADTPEGALGLPPPGMRAGILDQQTLQPCPPAQFDASGRIVNSEEAIGEIAALDGAAAFEGYYKNPEATADRIRGEAFMTGDLGYRDEAGFFYFAGRGTDRIRVDSENFSAAPIERILGRFEGVFVAAVYPVPDERTGDQAMATLQFADDQALARFDPQAFARFLAAQPDLGTKWAPKYVRVTADLPVTATRKINKPVLRRQAWVCQDPVFLRTDGGEYARLGEADLERINTAFTSNHRQNLLPEEAE